MSNEKKQVAWLKYDENEFNEVFEFNEKYIDFMSRNKTERECAKDIAQIAEQNGYVNIEKILCENIKIKKYDKIYAINKERTVALFNIGSESLEKGLNIVGAHIDSPRIDLKQNPLYEDSGLSLFKTHYYGGVKKYQWVALPMAIHGVFVKKDGSKVYVNFGEDPKEPVVGMSDLLIHLASEQMDKKMREGIKGEDLNVLVGSIPIKNSEEKECVKLNVLKILKDKYNIEEDDFISAEIEIVPAGKARSYGLDGSMVMAYGHDDRVCSYTALEAILSLNEPKKTCVALLVDKEEIGSVGATGMQSKFFENVVAEIMDKYEGYNDLKLRRSLANSKMLSADVSVAYDPNFGDVLDKHNAAYFGKGIVFAKYTGHHGKAECNDASPEFIAELREIMDSNNVSWQTGELGKVDQGGGGTIAYILAGYDMEVIDCGVAVQNMHAPWEVVSKADVYETMKAYRAFYIHGK